ncbi:hypothetical protein ATO8_08616 [Roseivivax marinus]|uniref:Transmembrane protein n=1 Tax=Roseivivax marinus TaxID=1379903 RepID=W4HMB3_9RHOB|nr:hypothetical protein [Roseivivax marinus]ETW13261.1 hypothetical protein ATO8_08616 [Roseivivax marinus]SEK71900.1 hypothetical protein SAMN05444413_10382 [Roseivivax marinus]
MSVFGIERSRSLWHLILAPTIWAIHFCVTYGMTAIWCERAPAASGDLRLWILIVTAVALAMILGVAWRAWRQWDYTDDYDYEHDGPTIEDRREFLGHAGFLLAVVSVIGVIYVALPAAFVGSCG